MTGRVRMGAGFVAATLGWGFGAGPGYYVFGAHEQRFAESPVFAKFGNLSPIADLQGFSDEVPVFSGDVDVFFMDATEVTKGLWDKVRLWAVERGYGDLPVGTAGHGANAEETDRHPVTEVSWYDAVKWCNARSEMEWRRPVYYADADFENVYRSGNLDVRNEWIDRGADGYRLPTEREREYAARGGLVGQDYPWAGAGICHTENYSASRANCSGTGTTQVGSFDPNGFGIYDMAGNATEWVWDWYGEVPGIHVLGPAERPVFGARVTRGGSWLSGPLDARCAARDMAWPDERRTCLGFRTVTGAGRTNAPTPYVLYSVLKDGQVRIRWRMAQEDRTVDFDVYRETDEGWVRVNDEPVTAHGAGLWYELTDLAADARGAYRYRLVEREQGSDSETYGNVEYWTRPRSVSNPRMEALSAVEVGIRVRWLARDLDVYHLQRSTNLPLFETIETVETDGREEILEHLDTNSPTGGPAFYRVRATWRE